MSSFLIAAPEALAAASADLSGIGEAIREARASAAPATTVISPPAADEVSAAITRLFGNYAADFQALSARAAAFHSGFVQMLLHSASAYAGTEAANRWSLQTLKQDLLGAINMPFMALTGRSLINNPATATPGVPMSQNLLVNPGFEVADPSVSGYSGVTIPGWRETGTPTVIPYGAPRAIAPSPLSFPFPNLPKVLGFPNHAPPGGGHNFAGGGPVGTSSISQTVNITGAAGTPYTLSGDLGGRLFSRSSTTVQVTFLSSTGTVVGTGSIGPVTPWERLGFTGFEQRSISGTIPAGADSAVVTTTFHDRNPILGRYNDAYVDNLAFTVGDPSLTPAPLTPPTSNVGQLDHVFLIYMENKGAYDILGSPNAPYLNSQISTQDYGSNYYALGHPSDPNYIRIMGGSDFGIAYNPSPNSINAPSLMQEMDQKGILWAGYAQSMPYPGDIVSSGNYSVDELPFADFAYVYNNNPAYLQTHLLPLTQLSTGLQNPNTSPQFTWIAADEAHNMEGPISTPSGVVSFTASQLTTHQYNIAAGDQFVQQTVSTVEASPTWTDPTQKDAIIITWDEDYNNLSLGIGNQGNNVPLIVIPNQAAINAGMQSGPFTTSSYYNQYSLMATIEDSLGLAPLTANDMYAQPMNAFWQ